MIEFVFLTLIIALFATFIILLTERVGIREKAQIRAHKLIAELSSCDFCLSFWVCLITSLVISAFSNIDIVLLTAIAATPITRKLL